MWTGDSREKVREKEGKHRETLGKNRKHREKVGKQVGKITIFNLTWIVVAHINQNDHRMGSEPNKNELQLEINRRFVCGSKMGLKRIASINEQVG